MIGETGIWSETEQHAHVFSFGIANWINQNIEGDFFDFGAGNGHYTIYLQDAHRICDAYDGYPQSIVKELDLSKHFNLGKKRNIICFEVGEHIPQQYESVFLNNLANHCDEKLIISWAIPNQDGIAHVNCRDNIYVIDKLQELGFKLNTKQTLDIRSVAEEYVSYFRNTLLIFDK